MIHFLFGTLWAVLFWVSYFIGSFFASAFIIKTLDRGSFNYLAKKGDYCKEAYNRTGIGFMINFIIIVFLFWPLILVLMSLYYTIARVVAPVFVKLILKADKLTPTIIFNKQDKEDKKVTNHWKKTNNQ